MGVGQPTKYRPEYCDQILAYFGIAPYREVEKTIMTKNGPMSIVSEVANDLPTLAGFAARIGVHRETLLNWSKDYPEFGEAYKLAKDLQENFIAVNGFKGIVPAAFAIFTAKNVCGWRDKQEIEHSGSAKDLTDEQINARIKEIQSKLGS